MSINVANLFGHKLPELELKPDNQWVLPRCNIGIEIEVEGRIHNNPVFGPNMQFRESKYNRYWKTVGDGSLRDGMELVTPILFGVDLANALTTLAEAAESMVAYAPVFSYRCSTHVHMDVRDMDKDQLLSLIFIYYMYEKYLFNFWGTRRYNNIYCMPLNKCHQFISQIGALINENSQDRILDVFNCIGEQERYCAFNLNALLKYGSVEFRHGEGTFSSGRLMNWINLLMCLKKYAMSIPPNELITIITDRAFVDISHEVFGVHYDTLFYETDPGTVKRDLLETKRRLKSIVISSFVTKQMPRIGDSYNAIYGAFKAKNVPESLKRKASTIGAPPRDEEIPAAPRGIGEDIEDFIREQQLDQGIIEGESERIRAERRYNAVYTDNTTATRHVNIVLDANYLRGQDR